MSARNRGLGPWLALSTLVVVGAVFFLTRPMATGAQERDIPRLGGTDHPNLTGVWQAVNEANWDLEAHPARMARVVREGLTGFVPDAPVLALGATGGIPGSLGVVVGGKIPYTPEALERREWNSRHTLERDREVKCLSVGVPRANYLPYPFQLTQGQNKIMMVYGYSNLGRTIHLDSAETAGYPQWMGDSVGRWDGDTLVVEVTQLNDENGSWLDRAGNFHGSELKVTERYTMTSPDHIMYEATLEDPTVFTRPWTISMPLYRRVEEGARVFPYRCVEWTEELVYGHLRKERLVDRWEGDYGRRGGKLIVDISRGLTDDPDDLQ